MKLAISRQIFEKYSNVKFHFKKSAQGGAELFHADRRMDKHNEANSRFSEFRERA